MEQELKNLIVKTLPNPSKFRFAQCTNSFSCYIYDLHLFISLEDGRFKFSLVVIDREELNSFVTYASTCFDLTQLEDEFKTMRNRLECRGLIPVDVAV